MLFAATSPTRKAITASAPGSNVDYEIHAEKDGAKSATRTVSSFDDKKDIVVNLKIERERLIVSET